MACSCAGNEENESISAVSGRRISLGSDGGRTMDDGSTFPASSSSRGRCKASSSAALRHAALLAIRGQASRARRLHRVRGYATATFFEQGARLGTEASIARAGRNAAGWTARIGIRDEGSRRRKRLAEEWSAWR